MNTLNIKVPELPSSQYPIYIASGIINKADEIIDSIFPDKAAYLISDINVKNAGILNNFKVEDDVFIVDPAGEESKNIHTILKIVEDMEERSLGRDTVVVAVGGGTVGDMAGFAAAIFKRGVPVVHIPTTTVSQADSSIGGKTGVDSSLSKNAFGAFHHPSAVIIDPAALKTLDQRQFNAGLAESIKHGLIADSNYFEYIEQNIDRIMQRDTACLEFLANKNCRIKGNVVEEDPLEKNKRRILNYGHTIGHAVESASGFEILHGEAVGIGMLAASLMEILLGFGSKQNYERIKALLVKLSIPTRIPADFTEDMLMEFIRRDKKATNKLPKFVLLENIGKVRTQDGQWAISVKPDIIYQALKLMY